jgi:hypothetical protein
MLAVMTIAGMSHISKAFKALEKDLRLQTGGCSSMSSLHSHLSLKAAQSDSPMCEGVGQCVHHEVNRRISREGTTKANCWEGIREKGMSRRDTSRAAFPLQLQLKLPSAETTESTSNVLT